VIAFNLKKFGFGIKFDLELDLGFESFSAIPIIVSISLGWNSTMNNLVLLLLCHI